MKFEDSPPYISIITACYNSAATLSHTLQSVAGQVNASTEHLIIDGGSTDGSLDIVRKTASVAAVVSEPDSGIYDAMNKGIGLARGEIIGILNADDFYASPAVLEKVSAVFQNTSADCCYGNLVYVDNQDTAKIVRSWHAGSCRPRKFYWGWMPPHPTFFVRRAVYERCGLFNTGLGSAADYELMLRLIVKYNVDIGYIDEILVKMRTGGVSNVSLKNRLAANRMDRKAWIVNGLKPYPVTLWLKPLRKIGQWVIK